MAVVQSKLSLLLQSSSSVDPDWNVLAVVLALGMSLDVLEVTDSPCQKVSGHDWRSLENNSVEAITLALLCLLLRHVAESDLVLRHLDLDVESGLEVRLIETGEGSASIACFELGAEHVMELVILGDGSGNLALRGVLGAVETSHDLDY